jgi:hypothetical protein
VRLEEQRRHRGDSVRAQTADKNVLAAIVRANWRYSSPVIPPSSAAGPNTAISTSEIATIGANTSFIARIVASRGARWWTAMFRSTFSTTTIASSTTMPIARIRPKSVSRLMLKPNICMIANVPMSETGTAISGMSVARHEPRNTSTTITTRPIGLEQRLVHFADAVLHELGDIVDGVVRQPRGEGAVGLKLVQTGPHFGGDLHGVGTRLLEDDDRRRRPAVEAAVGVVAAGAEFDAGDVDQPRHPAGLAGLDDDVAELLFGLQPAERAEDVLEVLPRRRRRLPDLPAATCTFCSRRASVMSVTLRPRAWRRDGSIQTRIE